MYWGSGSCLVGPLVGAWDLRLGSRSGLEARWGVAVVVEVLREEGGSGVGIVVVVLVVVVVAGESYQEL